MMVRKTKIIIIAVLAGVLCTSCGIPSTITQTASASEPALLLEDNFDDPTSGWEVSSQGGLKDYYQGTYHIKVADPNIFSWSVAKKSFGDVNISVDLAFTGSAELAEMGVICRMQNNQDFYFFTIRSDGGYAVFKMYQGTEFFLGMEGYQLSPAIHTGIATNHIDADCIGEKLSLYVNGTHLITVEDASFQVGDVGLLVGAYDEPDVNVFFDNYIVSQP